MYHGTVVGDVDKVGDGLRLLGVLSGRTAGVTEDGAGAGLVIVMAGAGLKLWLAGAELNAGGLSGGIVVTVPTGVSVTAGVTTMRSGA